jgi:hypothetical protein
MKVELYNVPGFVVGHYHPDINTIIDTWDSMSISLEDWQSTIYEMGILDFAPKNGVTAWITDTSTASGVFKPELQEFRASISAPQMAKGGIKCFFTVLPNSAIAKLSVRQTSKVYTGHGEMKSFTVDSMEEALKIREEELG